MSYYGRAEWTERAAALEAAAAPAQQARALDERLASVERTLDEIAMRRSPRRAGGRSPWKRRRATLSLEGAAGRSRI